MKNTTKVLTKEKISELTKKAFLLARVTSDIETYEDNEKVKNALIEICRVLIKELSEFNC